MRFKALISDVDETLITSKYALPNPKICEAVKKIRGKVQVGLATAKPFNQIKNICEYLDLSGPSIVSGGAQIVDVKTGRYYQEYLIDHETINAVYEILKKFDEKVKIWIQDNGIDKTFDESYKPDKPFTIVINKVSTDMAKKLINLFSHLPNIFVTKTPIYDKQLINVHISNENATKQNGVLSVAKILGIKPSEIIGVGDGYNDYPLLMACGLKVAMGNAVPELKEIADYVTKSVEEDGLAEVIRKYF